MAQSELNIRVTVISPGAIHINLLSSVTDKEMKAGFEAFYNTYAIPVERVALSIKQAIDLPEDSAWNEVIIRPTKQRV